MPLLLSGFHCALVCAIMVSKVIGKLDPISPSLKLVATVDGKSFFADSSVARNWTAAGMYCRSLGMKFASVSTQNQINALKNAYDSSDFSGEYWTSARDAHISRQFTWNSTGEELSSAILFDHVSQSSYNDYLTCVFFYIYSSQASGFFRIRCPFLASGVLCETSLQVAGD